MGVAEVHAEDGLEVVHVRVQVEVVREAVVPVRVLQHHTYNPHVSSREDDQGGVSGREVEGWWWVGGSVARYQVSEWS